MNLVWLLFIAALGFAFVVWVGRSGARTPQEFIKRKGRKALGFGLAALGLFLAPRAGAGISACWWPGLAG